MKPISHQAASAVEGAIVAGCARRQIPPEPSMTGRVLVAAGLTLAALASTAGCAAGPAAPAAPAEFLRSPDPALTNLPFSEAVRAGDFLFLSGQIGNVPGTLKLEPGGLEPEARRTLDNIRAILARHGATLDDVVKCTVFLADMRDWPAFNQVYRTVFTRRGAGFPARSALGASGLALGARVEVECLAYLPRAR
jgi:2-iminobutanoate/2-iminopropanoate deaminase